jgi:hypothetical protein
MEGCDRRERASWGIVSAVVQTSYELYSLLGTFFDSKLAHESSCEAVRFFRLAVCVPAAVRNRECGGKALTRRPDHPEMFKARVSGA